MQADGLTLHDHPLGPLCSAWLEKIKLAGEHKKKVFGDVADELQRFYAEVHDFMYERDYGRSSKGFVITTDEDETVLDTPKFRMTANKVAEFAELFGPLLYHRNPVRRVRPRQVPAPPPELFGVDPALLSDPMALSMADPMMLQQQQMAQQNYAMVMQTVEQQRMGDGAIASLFEFYLNYTPNELDLKGHCRKAVDEALIKGRGLLWTEMQETHPGFPFSLKLIGSFFDSVDNLFIDPDAEDLKDAKWVARRCCHPVWEVERKYGWPAGSIKANKESVNAQAETAADPNGTHLRKTQQTCDQLVYYKVYSRLGMGGRLKEKNDTPSVLDKMAPVLEAFGDYAYLVIAEGMQTPLNIPFEMAKAPMEQVGDELRMAVAWPIPFWADTQSPWPFEVIDFHPISRQSWPMAHLKPCLGYQKFLNWVYSLMANKIRVTCRDIIAILGDLDENVKNVIEKGVDLSILELKRQGAGETLDNIMKVLQMPQMNNDIWMVTEAIEKLFEKSSGMTDVLYGTQTGPAMRSAQEAALRGDYTRVRPDDMAQRVEEAMTALARKEALAARWMLEAQDVAPVVGLGGAVTWEKLVVNKDFAAVTRELEYRIEAGSTRKPNRELDLANANEAAQFLFPVLMQSYQATGDPNAANAFLRFWCRSRDLDASPFMLPPLQLQPVAPPPGEGAEQEGVAA